MVRCMRYILILSMLTVAGCDFVRGLGDTGDAPSVLPAAAPVEASVLEPVDSATGAIAPNATLPPPVGSGSSLGVTVVSLGDPAEGGMWLKTPLVSEQRTGQVRYRGTVVAVTLLPLDLPVGSGSQISVRAMQALGASLTDLVEVNVEAT